MTEQAPKERTCPVCDEVVPVDSKRCPHCSTDLSLFQVNGEQIEEAGDIASMDDRNGHVGELLKAVNGDVFESTGSEAGVGEDDTAFQCPECNALVPGDANTCPNCGVEFAEGDVFECPLCKTLVDINTDVCPNCNAEFADPGEDVSDAGVDGEDGVAVESTPPGPKEPMSFAERMKAMKEEQAVSKPARPELAPSPTPATEEQEKKELSFAERMKLLKEGKEVPKVSVEAPAPSPGTATPAPTPRTGMTETGTTTATASTPGQNAAPKPVPKERYKELPTLIGIVKKRLALAKRCDIDVAKSRALINQAVAAGKQKDLETAIRLVEEGKSGIEKCVSDYLNGRLRNLSARYEDLRKEGSPIAIVDAAIPNIDAALKTEKFEKALEELEKAERAITDSLGEDFVDAKSQFSTMEAAIKDAEALSMDIGDAHKLYTEAKQAVELEDWNSVLQYSKQGLDSLSNTLPDKIAGEMKRAKSKLLEIKMQNINITQPVEYLKQANAALRDGKYTSALHAIREFNEYLNKDDL